MNEDLNKLLEFDKEKELLIEKFGKMKRPFFFFPYNGLSILIDNYEKIGIEAVLYYCFFQLGRNTAKSIIEERNVNNINDFFGIILEVGKIFNWFEDIKIEKKDENTYLIKIKDCYVARREKRRKTCKQFAG